MGRWQQEKKLYGNFLLSSAHFFFFYSGRILVVEEGTRTKPCCASAAPQRIDSQIFPLTFLFSLLYAECILTRVSSPIFLSGLSRANVQEDRLRTKHFWVPAACQVSWWQVARWKSHLLSHLCSSQASSLAWSCTRAAATQVSRCQPGADGLCHWG